MDLETGVSAAKVSLVVNALLGAVKLTVGLLGGSVALAADGVHSLTDLAGSAVVCIGLRVAQRPADDCHPYGHRKAETIAATAVAVLVLAAGGNVLVLAGTRLYGGTGGSPGLLVVIAAAASVVIKESLFRYQKRRALLCGSTAVLACAWEQRADALSSVVVLAAVVASNLGFTAADAAAGIVVGLLVLRVGWLLLKRALADLMDSSVTRELLAKIEDAALAVDDVRAVRKVRARSAGAVLFVDMIIQVDGQLSVKHGHNTSQAVESAVVGATGGSVDLVVHVEPE